MFTELLVPALIGIIAIFGIGIILPLTVFYFRMRMLSPKLLGPFSL